MKFFIADEKNPAPKRKRKLVVNALEQHEEYLQMKKIILSGLMRPMQSAVITMGPEDIKALHFKWPWRTAVDQLRRLVRSLGISTEYSIKKYQTTTPGVWAVQVTYEPPLAPVAAVAADETEHSWRKNDFKRAERRRNRPRKMA